jgi:hypothetical protein
MTTGNITAEAALKALRPQCLELIDRRLGYSAMGKRVEMEKGGIVFTYQSTPEYASLIVKRPEKPSSEFRYHRTECQTTFEFTEGGNWRIIYFGSGSEGEKIPEDVEEGFRLAMRVLGVEL